VSFLDESNYLGSTPQTQMQLPQELTDALQGDVAPAPADGIMLPEGWIRLPGGIIMKKATALLLAVAITIAIVWWYKKHKK
jgi:hypothetical protein